MLKVLTGEHYSQFRLAGVLHECFCTYIDSVQNPDNVTMYLDGTVKANATTGEYGALIDTESMTYANLPQIHKDRLADVFESDGWMDTAGEV